MPTATPPADATGICDTHVHVLDPARFPYAGDRTYTPTAATLIELEGAMRHTGATRVVLVQPSVYGTDNSALIDSLDKLGSQAPGVAGGLTHCIGGRSN